MCELELVGCRRIELELVLSLLNFLPWGDLCPDELSILCFPGTCAYRRSADELPIVEVVDTSEFVRVRSVLLMEYVLLARRDSLSILSLVNLPIALNANATVRTILAAYEEQKKNMLRTYLQPI